MKTIKNIVIASVILVFSGSEMLYATNSGNKSGKKEQVKTEKVNYQQMAVNQLQELMQYPADLKQRGVEGFVLVSFIYDDEGNFSLTGANSNNAELLEHVTMQIAKMEMCSHVKKSGKEYAYRIDFKIY